VPVARNFFSLAIPSAGFARHAEAATLGDHVTTDDEIARRTGFDFLSELTDDAKVALESHRARRVVTRMRA
jgi:hypothetical protein